VEFLEAIAEVLPVVAQPHSIFAFLDQKRFEAVYESILRPAFEKKKMRVSE
jgi:hypothetical protein